MAKSKKPRKAYKPRGKANPLHVAINRATVLTAEEKARLLDPVRECYARLRAGELTNADFKHLADVFNLAEALTHPGISLLPDHVDKFDAAQDALAALAKRRAAGGSWTCRASELLAIETGIEFHAYQVDFASAGELARATQHVDRVLRGALSGSPGKGHLHTDLPEERIAA